MATLGEEHGMIHRTGLPSERFRLSVLVVALASAVAGCAQTDLPPVPRPADDNPPPIRGKIRIVFPKQKLSFTRDEVAQGVTFVYAIVVAGDIEDVTPKPLDIGAAAGPGPSGLYPFESISGNGHSYSLNDVGLGPGVFESRTIRKGTYELSFEWDGRNWTGPSDYGHPKGDPFPTGTYTLQVRLAGQVKTPSGEEPYEIKQSTQVTLTE